MPIRRGRKSFLVSTVVLGNPIISAIFRVLLCSSSIAALALFWSSVDASAAWKEKTSKNCWRFCHWECSGPIGLCTSHKKACDEEQCFTSSAQKKKPPSEHPPPQQPLPPPPKPVAAPAPLPAPTPRVPAGRCRPGYVYSTAQGICVPSRG